MKPYDTLFARYNISTAPYTDLNVTLPVEPLPNATVPLLPATRKAFLGRMGTDSESEHSIPNTWMASTPGHPFWLLPLERIKDHVKNGGSPEALTGPISLPDRVKEYQDHYHGESGSLDDHYAHSRRGSLYPARELESLEILPFWMIYPYPWQRDGDAYRNHCLVGQTGFNATRCKEVLTVEAWGSWSVTYWSHSWDADGSQHVEGLKEEKQGKDDEGKKEEKDEDEEEEEEDEDEEEAKKENDKEEDHGLLKELEEGFWNFDSEEKYNDIDDKEEGEEDDDDGDRDKGSGKVEMLSEATITTT